jgi:hypothetical protein
VRFLRIKLNECHRAAALIYFSGYRVKMIWIHAIPAPAFEVIKLKTSRNRPTI